MLGTQLLGSSRKTEQVSAFQHWIAAWEAINDADGLLHECHVGILEWADAATRTTKTLFAPAPRALQNDTRGCRYGPLRT